MHPYGTNSVDFSVELLAVESSKRENILLRIKLGSTPVVSRGPKALTVCGPAIYVALTALPGFAAEPAGRGQIKLSFPGLFETTRANFEAVMSREKYEAFWAAVKEKSSNGALRAKYAEFLNRKDATRPTASAVAERAFPD